MRGLLTSCVGFVSLTLIGLLVAECGEVLAIALASWLQPGRGLRKTAHGQPRSDRCTIFLHVPKTGGVTLRRALKWKYPSRILYDETLTKSVDALDQVPLSERASARIIFGHLHYGVHEHIPQQCDYVTLLREPVARVVSSYHYVRRDRRHWLHAELMRSSEPLEHFLRVDPSIDNHQTRMISGRGGGEINARGTESLDSDALDEAKRNLERFLVVGVTERFDETFILLRRALGWRLPYYVTANAARSPQPIAEAAREQVRERNQLDLELFRFANERLSTAIAEQGPSFPREVAALRALNRLADFANRQVSGRARGVLQAALPR